MRESRSYGSVRGAASNRRPYREHKNSILIMGPGGFRFSDYWPLGLALTLFVWIVGMPALLLFWPL